MSKINKSTWINAPLDKVFTLATNPEKWHKWFNELGVSEMTNGSGEVGTHVKNDYQIGGMKFPVETIIKDRTLDADMGVWTAKMEGPLAGDNHWTYQKKDGGTQVTMTVDYTVPGSVFGKLADKIVIERQQEKSAEKTLSNLKAFCEMD